VIEMRRIARRAMAFIVHNWPLKLAAIAVATMLYFGLVVSRDSSLYPGPIRVVPIDQPSGTVITNDIRDVEQVRYLAPADAGRLTAEDFRVTVNLSDVKPDGVPVNVRVDVKAIDPRVTILEVTPRTIQIVLDQSIKKTVEVVVDRGTPPAGLDIGETVVDPPQVAVSGASAAVNRVVSVRASTPIDASGLDIDREVQPVPIDASGGIVTGVELDPRTVHVTIPIYTNKESRTLPVNPIITGTPAAGFRIASIEVTPLAVSVEGDQDQLVALIRADTEPVPVFGATSDVSVSVAMALPTGVTPLGVNTISVTVRIEPITETRTFTAGLRLDGRQPGLEYQVAQDRVLLTLYGSVVYLDRLDAAPIVVGLNVATLGPGSHEVPVVPSLPSGVTVADLSPQTVTVTITVPATPTPPTPTPSPSPSPAPSGAP
jgi:YbbR domain-containing protein